MSGEKRMMKTREKPMTAALESAQEFYYSDGSIPSINKWDAPQAFAFAEKYRAYCLQAERARWEAFRLRALELYNDRTDGLMRREQVLGALLARGPEEITHD